MAFPFKTLFQKRDGTSRFVWAQRLISEPPSPNSNRVPFTGRTAAGVRITPDTAICISTVWACIRYISQTVAQCPWQVMQGTPGIDASRASLHPIDKILGGRPSPEYSSFQFRETLTHWALRWGNGYAEIERMTDSVYSLPIALHPIHPDRVIILRNSDTGNLFYRVYNGTAGTVDLDPQDMFHLRGFGEGPVGVNVMNYAAESLGWARAVQLFGASFFGSGMNLSGIVKVNHTMKDKGMRRLRTALNNLYRGARGEKFAILDDTMDFKPVAIEPEKAQFVATNQFLVDEICRWFGVPPSKVAQLMRATFNNIESQAIEVLADCVIPWTIRWEQEADFKMFGSNRPGYYTHINLISLLRGDSAARAAYYDRMRMMGVFSANDILRLEQMNTITKEQGGDMRVMQAQMVPLEMILKGPVSPASGSGPTPPNATPGPSEPSPVEKAAMAALMEMEYLDAIR
jgi:HK97 family phage portal protein